MSRVVVLVPLKPFERAKSRLGGHYDDATRARIARTLAERVLGAVVRAFPDADRIVVGEPSIAGFARENGARLVEEPIAGSLGAKLDATLDALTWDLALVVMGDLPDVSVTDLVSLRDADADLALAEGADGVGTNAMMLRAPRRLELAFAEPASCDLHEARARSAGLRVARLRLGSLARDLDRPSDLTEDEEPGLAAPREPQ